MHQCGLRPPADGARCPCSTQILADVGDEQSIARSLSTFSGHLRTLAAILRRGRAAHARPARRGRRRHRPDRGRGARAGAARARCGRGAQTLATTHYPELKEWAARHEGVENASVGFDAETLRRPTR